MHDEARIRAYAVAIKDPFAFLQKHYRLRPGSAPEVVANCFADFARQTGVGLAAVSEATAAFRNSVSVAPFVLQAASAEKASAYETA